MTHASGAIHEIALLLLLGCAAVELLAAPAVGLVSAMIQLFLFFKKFEWLNPHNSTEKKFEKNKLCLRKN